MVYINGQKFACVSCINGHRSSSCNHGDRPLHEIKKKGRPSTHCSHCKDLRKAKHVQARCICGRQDALKHSKSISHDGRIPLPTDIGGDDLIRSVSSDSCDFTAAAAAAVACPCSQQELEEQQQQQQQAAAYHQLGSASQDFAAYGSHSSPRDSLPHSLFTHQLQGQQSRQSPDGSVSSCSNLSINGTFAGLALHGNDPSASNSPIVSMAMSSHRQSHLCYDYASSSDCESDHYNPPTQVIYPSAGYAISNGSDDLGERDLKTVHTLQSTPNFSSSSSSSHLSQSFSTNIPSSSSSTSKKACCKPSNSTSSPAIPTPPTPPPPMATGGGYQGAPGAAGCGCAISPTMCCCGEFCACPGCLAYPNNAPVQGYRETVYSSGVPVDINQGTFNNTRTAMDQAPAPKGSCCESTKANNNTDDASSNAGARALNLGHALTLLGASHQNGSAALNDEMRQALQQGFGAMDQATLDSVKMQHPTLLGSNGVLICGCGCGRPTVDCADCFRDMCEFVGESQAKMLKDELEYEMSMNREGGYLADLGLNMNISNGLNLSHSTIMELDDEIGQFNQEDLDQQQEQQPQRKLTEQEEALRLQMLELEQMELSKMRPATINQLQLDFLDDEDWSFVDEIRTDHLDTLSIPRPSPPS